MIFARGKDANALWSYARARGWDEHDDIAAMGQLKELMRVVHSGKVAIVLASSLDGLASTVPELIAVVREFVERGIRLVVPFGKVDTSAMPRERMLKFLEDISEFRHTVTAENIREGLARARKAGVQLGRPHSVNPHRDEVVALREQGLSGRKIAKALGLPSPTVFKIIGQL